jgi:dTMP kinase
MNLQKLKGKFITFEGVEGAGKSTQSKLLAEYLNPKGIEAIWTREPGGSQGAEEIRNILIKGSINKWDGITELLLMYAARRDHTEKKIKPAIKEGKVIICDRYFDSTVAYQGFGHNLDLKKIQAIKKIVLEDFMPDLSIILDIDIQKGQERTYKRGERNRFDNMKLDFHQKVREGYHSIAKNEPERCKIINVENLNIEDVQKKILNFLDSHF